MQPESGGIDDESSSHSLCTSDWHTDKEEGLQLCRVCHCAEPDQRGDAALSFLDIVPPQEVLEVDENDNSTEKVSQRVYGKDVVHSKNSRREPRVIKFVSPDGEVFICSTDIESGSFHQHDMLVDLGCSCKNELAIAHYACALKWFISHGSTVCEICGSVARSIRPSDFKKVVASLKDYESLRERTATGEVTHLCIETNSGVDPDALAAIRRQRLSEVSLWFNPHNNSTTASQGTAEQSFSIHTNENIVAVGENTSRWALEGTSVLVATGLLSVALVWLIAPHVGKKIGTVMLYLLLGVLCALTVMVSFRFIFRFKYGPVRYWVISFVFGFLNFGLWAQRTRAARSQ